MKENAYWGLGIVTGNNSKFCFNEMKHDSIPIYKGSDITYDGLKKPSNYISKNLSLYQQAAPKSFYEAKQKLIYKFISKKLCFYFDKEQKYILNSANMLILKEDFPIISSEMCKFFNSKIINWLFTKIFNTHKILRKDLESIPIHAQYFQKNSFLEDSYLKFIGIEKKNGTYRVKKCHNL